MALSREALSLPISHTLPVGVRVGGNAENTADYSRNYSREDTTMKAAAIRAIRTFLQSWLGTFAVLAIPMLTNLIKTAGDAEGYLRIDVTALGNAAIAGVIAGVIALISFLQNALEDNTSINVPK